MTIEITIPQQDLFCNLSEVDTLPTSGGIYMFYDEEQSELLYIGKAQSLRQRVKAHLKNVNPVPSGYCDNTWGVKHNFRWIKVFCVDCPMERDIYETYLINILKPALNVNKVYLYKTSRKKDKYKSDELILFEKKRDEKWQRNMDIVCAHVNL